MTPSNRVNHLLLIRDESISLLPASPGAVPWLITIEFPKMLSKCHVALGNMDIISDGTYHFVMDGLIYLEYTLVSWVFNSFQSAPIHEVLCTARFAQHYVPHVLKLNGIRKIRTHNLLIFRNLTEVWLKSQSRVVADIVGLQQISTRTQPNRTQDLRMHQFHSHEVLLTSWI